MSKITREYALTPNRVYQVTTDIGQGSLCIGLEGMDKKYYDVLIEPNQPVNWDTFNEYYTGSGEQNKHLYPYGNFPRWFIYYGNDISFIEWSKKRKIEGFDWCPQQNIEIDFSNAQIHGLSIYAQYPTIIHSISAHSRRLYLKGDLNLFDIQHNASDDLSLSLSPALTKNDEPYQIPFFSAFKTQKSLDISGQIAHQAIDCRSLLAYEELESLALSGNVINLQALSQLKHLTSLQLRYIPDLSDLIDLTAFPKLESILLWNVEEQGAKRLKAHIKQHKNQLSHLDSHFSQLKKASWFVTEYQMPFSAWEGKNAKTAVKLYKNAVKSLKKLDDVEQIKAVIVEFVCAFNALEQIETTEREDIGTAVLQLIQVPNVIVDDEIALQWFDEGRDY
ncbi:hypothetical protein [Moraxella sp. ZY210820]|uniref:hypothetical protein n=1 Tax=unclassified Moraxella TaxID=2685852 RepID=UPI002731661C|nr:hypothetical protein [Moraxella sp. ZY210820]WLF83896.1 hypothetical protein LU301_11790 [Moraxella sp. ZY210820]